MFTLLKYNPLFRRTHLACLVIVLLAVLLLPLVGDSFIRNPFPRSTNQIVFDRLLLTTCLIDISVGVMLINVRYFSFKERIGELERSLPITFRNAYFQKVLSMWIAVAAPLLTACILIAAYLGFGERTQGLIPVGGKFLASITAGIVVLFAWSPRSFRLSTLHAGILAFAALMVMFVPFLVGFDNGIYLHLTIIVAGVAWISARIPKGMLSDATLKAPSRSTKAGEPLWARFLTPLKWVMIRSTILRPRQLFLYTMYALVISVVMRGSGFFDLWFPIIIVFQGISNGLVLINGMDALPIGRQRMAPFIVLPSLAVLIGLYSTKAILEPRFMTFNILSNHLALDRTSENTVSSRQGSYGIHLKVPPRAWELGSDNEAHTIIAPWGERMTPLNHPIFPGAPTAAFNPYDIRDESSIRFATWQISRALERISGETVTPDQVHRRWFSEHALEAKSGKVLRFFDAPKEWQGYGGSHTPNRPASGALFAILIWFCTAAFVTHYNRPGLTLKDWKRARLIKWLTCGLAFGIFMCYMLFDMEDGAVVPVLLSKFHSWLDALLKSSPIAWAFLVLIAASFAYTVISARIKALETPTLPKIGWAKKEISIF
ncbi:MAG: hypothetical protein GY949_08495 [Gammaproteobacteria bacterium]|nr:hypothetical protein [Gammaproteobacteria bacterium]